MGLPRPRNRARPPKQAAKPADLRYDRRSPRFARKWTALSIISKPAPPAHSAMGGPHGTLLRTPHSDDLEGPQHGTRMLDPRRRARDHPAGDWGPRPRRRRNSGPARQHRPRAAELADEPPHL